MSKLAYCLIAASYWLVHLFSAYAILLVGRIIWGTVSTFSNMTALSRRYSYSHWQRCYPCISLNDSREESAPCTKNEGMLSSKAKDFSIESLLCERPSAAKPQNFLRTASSGGAEPPTTMNGYVHPWMGFGIKHPLPPYLSSLGGGQPLNAQFPVCTYPGTNIGFRHYRQCLFVERWCGIAFRFWRGAWRN